jgi:hypothetical protein
MPFIPMRFKPGLNRDQTNYSNEGGWFECDKVRFRSGYPEKLGGWVRYTLNAMIGTCRQMFGWVTSFQDNLLALGTNKKVYIEAGNNLFDITPLKETTSAGDVTFAAVDGSNVLTVLDVGSNADSGGFVTFSGAVSLGGNVTATILNAEHEIQTNINADAYTIEVSVTANASDSGDGGNAVIGEYQINPGLSNATFGYGWGTGTWGRETWGSGSNQPVNLPQRTWFFDNFDNDLVMNILENGKGPIYIWERGSNINPTTAIGTRAVLLSSLMGANEVPAAAGQVLVSQNDKHLLAFGAVPYTSSNVADFDPLLIRWADQDNPIEWEPTPTNSAGFFRISRGDAIVRALATRQEILVYTNTGLSSLQFTGTTDVFSLQELSDNISVMSPRCFATANNVVFWMGYDKFYLYSGRVDTLPTSLWSQVFRNFNYDRADNVVAGTNEGFNEVWWMYPSINSNDNDSYVIFNYVEKIWYYGTIERTAWLDSGLRDHPQAVGIDGYVYDHEVGHDDGILPMESFILSSDFDLGDGENFMLTRRIIPDVKFQGSTNANPEVGITLVPRRFPGSTPQAEPNLRVIETSADVYTNEVYIRARGRSMSFKISSDELGVNWQLGVPRLDARPDGKR